MEAAAELVATAEMVLMAAVVDVVNMEMVVMVVLMVAEAVVIIPEPREMVGLMEVQAEKERTELMERIQ